MRGALILPLAVAAVAAGFGAGHASVPEPEDPGSVRRVELPIPTMDAGLTRVGRLAELRAAPRLTVAPSRAAAPAVTPPPPPPPAPAVQPPPARPGPIFFDDSR